MHSNKIESSAKCRTCEKTSELYFKLTTRNEKHPEKTLSDMLLELAKIDVTSDNVETLPQQLCITCTQRLKNAYDFVFQAQQINQRLLESVCEVGNKGDIDCLLEAPIDITSHDFIQIKMEVEASEEAPIFAGTDHSLETKIAENAIPKDESVGDESDDQWRNSDPTNEEFNDDLHRSSLSSDDSDEQEEPVRRLRSSRIMSAKRIVKKKTNEEDSASDNEYLPTKRRRGRPRSSKRHSNGQGRFVCDVCGKTFAWHKDVQRHAKSHTSEVMFICDFCGKGFQRKDKYVDHLRKHTKITDIKIKRRMNFLERLYSANRFKLLECRLCANTFDTIQDLVEHLSTHKDVSTLDALNMDNVVIKEFYASGDLDIEKIKEAICADISALSYKKYCLLLNEYGYEMSIDDSDEDIPNGDVKYVCELCGESFTRKYQTLAHAQEKHKNDAMPYRCNVCKLFFISGQLIEQHTRTQCRNRDKKYKCLRCPGKFMWAENLEQHRCANSVRKFERSDQEKEDMEEDNFSHSKLVSTCKPLFDCGLCMQSFDRLKQLRAHVMLHQDGKTEVDYINGNFFKLFFPEGVDGREAELSTQIAADFATQDFARYYAALSERGDELDLYDSETTVDEEHEKSDSSQQQKPTYICGICGETCGRRTLLLHHQESQHAEQALQLPFPCEKCGKQYVCAELLKQHQLRDCLNRHKTIQCDKCDARFVWPANCSAHCNIKHTNADNAENKLARKLQCDQCDKVFIWPKDLTRHKRVHLPDTDRYECPYCERKFLRKDNMQSHIKVHSEEAKRSKPVKVKTVDAHLCKPHGCKRIECMICHTKHRKISDLRTHLSTHQYTVSFAAATGDDNAIESISQALYPEEESPLMEEQLIKRIMSDIKAKQFERFYSITNEAGYELSLESSETESDSEPEADNSLSKSGKYNCELCAFNFQRKYQLYAHQHVYHIWKEASYTCAHCKARFISDSLLEHHMRTLCRNTQKRFMCRKCPQRFRWKENFRAHGNTHCDTVDVKQVNTNFECHECNRSFQMQKDLTRHMFMHSRESAIFGCQWCPRKFYRRGNLTQHLERHGIAPHELAYAETLINVHKYANGKKVILCKVCNIKFERIAELRDHLQNDLATHHSYESMLNYSITNQLGFELHLEDSETDDEAKVEGVPASYTCELCQLVCRRKHELFRHQQAMHKLEKIELKCTHCVFKSVSADLLAYHKRTQCENVEKKYSCTECNLKFMWEDNLAQHVQLHHTDSAGAPTLKAELAQNEAKPIFQCPHCTCKYNRKDRLTAHVKKMHGVNGGKDAMANTAGTSRKSTVEVSAEQKLKKADDKRFLCAFCGKAVSSSSNLIIHMRRHTGEKPFKCDFCEMAFARSSDMQCHRRTHTGERPYKCTVCDKAFSRSYKLHQHMRIHNGERPYKCTYCEKSFTQSNDLTLHIRRHTGERPYVCGICGERFIQGTALKNHRIMRGHFEEVDAPPTRRTILEQFRVS